MPPLTRRSKVDFSSEQRSLHDGAWRGWTGPVGCFRAGFRDVEDYIKLVDFGIAHQYPRTPIDDEAPLTHAGAVLGTVYYMPPEQAAGDVVDHRVDCYATAVLLYQMITGALPFRGGVSDRSERVA